MKKGKVINLNFKGDFYAFLVKNKVLLFVIVFFSLGIILGNFVFIKNDLLINFSNNYLIDFFDNRIDSNFINIVINSIFKSLLIFIIIFAFGSSIFGLIFIPIIIFSLGVIYSSISAILYSEYLLKGIAFHSVIILPSAAILFVGILFCAKESIEFSYKIAELTFKKNSSYNLSNDFKYFCGKNILFLLFVVISSFVDGLISSSFLKSFNLF